MLLHRAHQNLKDFLCKNCSLYASDNPCHCENLVNFSLAQGWVEKPEGDLVDESHHLAPEAIQAEVEGVRKVVELYQSLAEKTSSDNFAQQIRDVIDYGFFKKGMSLRAAIFSGVAVPLAKGGDCFTRQKAPGSQ